MGSELYLCEYCDEEFPVEDMFIVSVYEANRCVHCQHRMDYERWRKGQQEQQLRKDESDRQRWANIYKDTTP